jgi:hypothetical protein
MQRGASVGAIPTSGIRIAVRVLSPQNEVWIRFVAAQKGIQPEMDGHDYSTSVPNDPEMPAGGGGPDSVAAYINPEVTQAIINGHLAPGSKLSPHHLAKEFKVSHTQCVRPWPRWKQSDTSAE